MQANRITLVAILTVRTDALSIFRAFERKAAVIMAIYGGAIERAVVIASDDTPGLMKEVHIVTFPSHESFHAYQQDPDLASLALLRQAAVVNTEILIGQDGPDYMTAI